MRDVPFVEGQQASSAVWVNQGPFWQTNYMEKTFCFAVVQGFERGVAEPKMQWAEANWARFMATSRP